MGASTSTLNNNMKNFTVNKSVLDVLNQQVNEYVSNSVTTAASKCSASSSTYNETKFGNIKVTGSGNSAKIGVETQQDSQLSFQCIQQSIQETNIGNNIAQSIMNNLNQSVSADIMNKIVSAADASMEQGVFANPFASGSSEVNVNLSNIQITDTNRKLSNLIKNSVANNVKTQDIKSCFLSVSQGISNQIGDVEIVGQENSLELYISSKQLSKSFANCSQLTQQTSAVINAIASQLGLKVIDDTKTKTSTESESTASTKVKATGLDGLLDSLLALLSVPFIIGACAILCLCICCIIILFIFKSSGSNNSYYTSENTEENDLENTDNIEDQNIENTEDQNIENTEE
jgi:hypothetical protein